MKLPGLNRIVVLAVPLAMAACGNPGDVTMVDPRTGVSVLCGSGRVNVFAPGATSPRAATCADVLARYGFYDVSVPRGLGSPPPSPVPASPFAAPLPPPPLSPPVSTQAFAPPGPAVPYTAPLAPLAAAPAGPQPLAMQAGEDATWYVPDSGPAPAAPQAGPRRQGTRRPRPAATSASY